MVSPYDEVEEMLLENAKTFDYWRFNDKGRE